MASMTMLSIIRTGDLVAVVIYLTAMAALAVYVGRRNRDTEGYFLGGRSIPGWAIGLSLIGTTISSITFIALPAAAIALDWRLMVPNYTTLVGAILAIAIFIPLFRALPYTTAYEFLEKRVGRFARTYAASMVVVMQLLRVGAVLYLASVPISLILGVPIPWVIVFGGLFILLYSTIGGITAVIWTDVTQTIILWVGGVLVFIFAAMAMPDGLLAGWSIAWHADKFSVGEMDWDLARRTFWTMLLVGMFDAVGEYASNQNVVQRYMAARSTGEARKAVLLAAVLTIPTWIFFYLIGTTLWSLYEMVPDEIVASMTPEEIVPYFVMTQLPVGIAGIIVAAIMAAAMSTLDSSINAISSITVTDVVRRYLAKGRSERFYLVCAKAISVLVGLTMIGVALVVYALPRESIMDLLRLIGSIFGGVVPGIFFVAIFARRVGPFPILLAIPVGVGVKLYFALGVAGVIPAQFHMPIHGYVVGPLSNIALVVVALLLSFIWPRQPEDPEALMTDTDEPATAPTA
jgi:SSS family solute:Na+ symporter